MNLNKLFEMQKELDEKILERFTNLKNEDLLPKKILALQVELGELCQEWRGFKFWSEKQTPLQKWSGGCDKCDYWEAKQNNRQSFSKCDCFNGLRSVNTILEEYVDVLHFILSIGLELNVEDYVDDSDFNLYAYESLQDTTKIFNLIFRQINMVEEYKDDFKYRGLWTLFMVLGNRLGFTWEQIEQAYMSKNAENHAR